MTLTPSLCGVLLFAILSTGLATAATIQVPVTLRPSDFIGAEGLVTYTTTVSGTQVTVTAGNDTPGRAPVLHLNASGGEIGVYSNNESLANAQSYTLNSNLGNKEWLRFDLVAPSGSGRLITDMDFNRIQQTARVIVENISDGASTTFDVGTNAPIFFPAFAAIPSLHPGSTGLSVTVRNGTDVQIGWQRLTIIPEPSRSVLLMGGLLLAGCVRRRG